MTRFGYTLMPERNGSKDLVQYAISAEHRGLDFQVVSDHFSPWLVSQGHAPNAWAVLGAVAQVTDRVDLYTYVTCPTMRYHPAIVAQQAATVQILADGRFTLSGRVVGQIPICWDTDRDAAIERAHDQFRWFGGGWKVNADLPTPAGFAGATQFVRLEDVADSIPCGPDLDAIVDAVRPYREAGFTDIALLQVGGDSQEEFLKEAAEPLLAALRSEGEH